MSCINDCFVFRVAVYVFRAKDVANANVLYLWYELTNVLYLWYELTKLNK